MAGERRRQIREFFTGIALELGSHGVSVSVAASFATARQRTGLQGVLKPSARQRYPDVLYHVGRMRNRCTLEFVALAALAVLPSCSEEPKAPVTPPVKAAIVHPAQIPHLRDERTLACTAALEKGDLGEAQNLILGLSDPAAPDSICLRARLLAAQGDSVGAVREIESALKLRPDQGSLYATLAEIHATGGRLESAQSEVRDGLLAAGPTPDLSRAQGVLLLLQPRGAKAAMAHLQRAIHEDPQLAFCAAPLSEAHRLIASEALADQKPLEALSHAKAGLAIEPDHPELQLLRADALIASGDFDQGLPAFEELARAGRELGASLALYYQKGATAALVEGRKELAFDRYLRARQLGASDTDLGFGAKVLERAAVEAQENADKHFGHERWGDARAQLDKLLAIRPEDLAARTQLGVACFKLEDYPCAEACWREVIERADRLKIELPDPVHLKLANALRAQGRQSEIKPLLDQYLAAQPSGEWAELTREALARLGR